MRYILYIAACLFYIGMLYIICGYWQWTGWLSYVGHILSILSLSFLFIVVLGGLVIYFNRKAIWRFTHDDVLVPIQVYFEFLLNPFNWFSSDINDRIQKRIKELRYR